MEGECTHHCATLAPYAKLWRDNKEYYDIFEKGLLPVGNQFVTDKCDKRFELGTNSASGQNENKILDCKSDALTTGPCCLALYTR